MNDALNLRLTVPKKGRVINYYNLNDLMNKWLNQELLSKQNWLNPALSLICPWNTQLYHVFRRLISYTHMVFMQLWLHHYEPRAKWFCSLIWIVSFGLAQVVLDFVSVFKHDLKPANPQFQPWERNTLLLSPKTKSNQDGLWIIDLFFLTKAFANTYYVKNWKTNGPVLFYVPKQAYIYF